MLCYTPFICENTAFPFQPVLSLTDVFLLLASGLRTEKSSLAMPADSCSIIPCPGILFFIHLDTGCVLQKINKTCFENVPSFLNIPYVHHLPEYAELCDMARLVQCWSFHVTQSFKL